MLYMVMKTIREGYCCSVEDSYEQCIGPFCNRVTAETVLCNLSNLPEIQNAWIEEIGNIDEDEE
jgi:hypothetical protein